MYVCFAVLLPYEIQNDMRKMILQTSRKHSLDLVASLLPQHISLKISFNVSEIDGIEEYFTEFAQTINSFSIQFSKVELLMFDKDLNKQGLVWIGVKENIILKELCSKLNRELKEKFNIQMAVYDGDGFHFHSTMVHSGQEYTPFESYEKAYTDLEKMEFNKPIEINEIAMFVSNHDKEAVAGTFITYKVLKLKKYENCY